MYHRGPVRACVHIAVRSGCTVHCVCDDVMRCDDVTTHAECAEREPRPIARPSIIGDEDVICQFCVARTLFFC